MSEPPETEHVEITDGDRTVAAAEVSTTDEGETARASLHAAAGHIVPGRRAAWSTPSWTCRRSRTAPGWRRASRSATPSRWSGSGSGPTSRARDPAGSTALLDANIRPAAESREAAEGAADPPADGPAPGELPG